MSNSRALLINLPVVNMIFSIEDDQKQHFQSLGKSEGMKVTINTYLIHYTFFLNKTKKERETNYIYIGVVKSKKRRKH